MEEDIRKQGMLYLQQQRFGKKWKRVWCILFRESSCSISRLEFFECKDGGNVEKSRKQQDHKKVIRLSDCIRVSEVDMDGCPRDTGPFLIETTDKTFVFAAERLQLEAWTHKLCETAFPMKWSEPKRGKGVHEQAGMEDNSLYSGTETVRDVRVCVRRTEASERCRLKGDGFLRADVDALLLLGRSGEEVLTWPYRYLRRFGRDKSTFSFEAGRRCDSGEGSFEFETQRGNFLFQAVESAIHRRISFPQRQTSYQTGPETPEDPPLVPSRTAPLPLLQSQVPQSAQEVDGVYSMVSQTPPIQKSHHRNKDSSSPSHQKPQQRLQTRLEPPGGKMLTGVKSLTLDTRAPPPPHKNQLKMISSLPLSHGEPGPHQTYSQIVLPGDSAVPPPAATPVPPQDPGYSLPFDTIGVTLVSDLLILGQRADAGTDPLYDSIDEMKIRNVFPSDDAGAANRKLEHIYDEPEGCAAPLPPASLYDNPEEVRGDAWRVMGTEADPKGHEYPYNPRVDDYAVPKRAHRALPAARSTNEEEKEEDGVEEVEEEEEKEEEGEDDSPYTNVMVKMA
ncbi:docking protein 2 isoform 2-T2 [Spinachia spinachia]